MSLSASLGSQQGASCAQTRAASRGCDSSPNCVASRSQAVRGSSTGMVSSISCFRQVELLPRDSLLAMASTSLPSAGSPKSAAAWATMRRSLRIPPCAFFISSRAWERSPIQTSASAENVVRSSSCASRVVTSVWMGAAASLARNLPSALAANCRTRLESRRAVEGTGSGSVYLSLASSTGMARASPRSPRTSAAFA